MVSLSLKMLWKERQRATGLTITIVTTLCVTIVLLQFFNNPHINYLLSDSFRLNTYDDLIVLFDAMYKGAMILILLTIFVALLMNACDYYNKSNSKICGLLRVSGYSVSEILRYQMIQIVIIVVISYLLGIVVSFLLIPVSQFFAYAYMGINANIFKYSLTAYKTSFYIMLLIMIFIMLMEVSYFICANIPKLLKCKTDKAFKIRNNARYLTTFIYTSFFIIGVVSLYISEFNQGLIVPISMYVIGTQGLCKTIIPNWLRNKLKTNKLGAIKTLVYSNYIVYLAQFESVIKLVFLSIGILTIMTCTNLNSAQYFVLFQLGYVLTNIILSFTFFNRFKINQLDKKDYYQNLKRLGLDQEQLLMISKREIVLVYNTVIILVLIYLLNLGVVLSYQIKMGYFLAILIVLEFIIPIGIAYAVTLYKESENVNNGYNH